MNLGFIGAGSMGAMLIRATVRFGAIPADQVWAANRTAAKLDRLVGEIPGIRTGSVAQVVKVCPVVFICLKPQDTLAILDQFDAGDRLLIVLNNMLPLPALEERVPPTTRLAKVVPSLGQEVGAGVTLVSYGSRATEADRLLLEGLLARISRPVVIDEAISRGCTSLASCGPAFLAYVLEAMVQAATVVHPGLTTELSRRLAVETLRSTALLLSEGGMGLEDVQHRIAVPGGMTAEGLRVLEHSLPQVWSETYAVIRDAEAEKRSRLGL